MKIRFKSANELIAYVHEPGFEIWSVYANYPETLKPFTIVKNEAGVTDFAIQKSVHYKANKCVDDSNYNQHQCLLEEYRSHFEKLGTDCIPPWGHSLLVSTEKNCGRLKLSLVKHLLSKSFMRFIVT